MVWSFELFRIAGIRIRIHITFILIFIWGAYYWGSIANDGSSGALFGVVATLLLFLCVTLHELGHSVQARAYGIPVEDITLYPLGGVARLSQMPEQPGREFRIAIAGPLVNVALLGLMIVIGRIAGVTALRWPGELFNDLREPSWQLLIPYLAFANLSLALFNLLPAFPMDGGRILRALLAMRLDFRRATAIAVAVGQVMAFLFGLYGFATGSWVLIVIAVFVWLGAGEEGQQTTIKQLLGGTTVGQAMIQRPWSLAPEYPLTRAVELTLTTAQSDFPVLERDGRVVGLLTLGDLLSALQERPNAKIGDVMRRDFPPVMASQRITDIQEHIAAHGGRALPVVTESGQLAGLITMTDIAEAIQVLSARSAQAGRHPTPHINQSASRV